MFCDDRFPSHSAAKSDGSIRLDLRRVQGLESLKVFLHARRHKIIYGVLGSPKRVPTSTTWRASQNLKHSVGRWLDLVGHLIDVRYLFKRWLRREPRQLHQSATRM